MANKLSDILSGVDSEEENDKGIKYAIDFIQNREQLDRLSNLSKEDMLFLMKLYTISIMLFNSKTQKARANKVIDKYLALRGSVMGFTMTKTVDMFKTDIEHNQVYEPLK